MKTNIKLTLLAPLMHFSDESLGTMQIQRTLKFNVDGEFIEGKTLTSDFELSNKI